MDDFGEVVFLEEADGGDAGCAGAETGFSVQQSDASQGEHWDIGTAGLAESFEAGRNGSGRVFFFEDGSEDGQVCTVGGGLNYFFRRVTGDGDQRVSW